MPSKKPDETIDLLLNPVKFLGELVSEVSPVFQTPRFTLKDLKTLIINISYSKLNDWENKNLIVGNKDGAWRKFSIVDLLKLQIIDGLKDLQIDSENIREIITKISTNCPVLHSPSLSTSLGKDNHIEFEYYFFLCWTGDKYYLIIKDKSNPFFLTEAEFANLILNSKFLFTSAIILPFFEYVQKVSTFMNKNISIDENTTIRALFEAPLSLKEKLILEIIRKEDFEEVKITRNGKEIIIRNQTTQKGSLTIHDVVKAIEKKDYQNIQIARVKGQIINISREETYKA